VTSLDTIFALATAPGRAAIAVVRLSGPEVGQALDRLAGRRPSPRRASLRSLRGADGTVLDDALVLWLPGPNSYTGEDSAELHLHGGRAVVEAVTEALVAIGVRPAEPGEFTRRAFQNGKLDLSQAEAVADLIDAETSAQRKQALDQLDGALGRKYEAWRGALIDALAFLEAEIDFPDEDLPDALAIKVGPMIDTLTDELTAALGDAARGERVREGWRVAFVGAPNAGKSSLFNRLVRREAAIVTPIAGTTRDVLEASFTLAGYRVMAADTAGVRESADPIEVEGVRRARAWADSAAMRLIVIDSAGSDDDWHEGLDLARPGDLVLLNKADQPQSLFAQGAVKEATQRGLDMLAISASSGEGFDGLESRLSQRVASDLGGSDFPAVTRERHRIRLSEALDHLNRGREALRLGPELAAEDLRLAARSLGRVSGRVDPEDILDVVFASFCIGK
jgi:tRNA modification GTPase